MRNAHALAMLLSAAALAGCCPDTCYEETASAPTVRLPQDEAPHCSGGEWWYYTGRLTTERGAGYGLETVIFHAPQPLYIIGMEGWIAHVAVLDETTGAFRYSQGLWLEPPTRGPVSGFDLSTPLLHMTGGDGQDAISGAMQDGSIAFDLSVSDIRGPILHDGSGYVSYGAAGKSFYYSRPQMQAAGTLTVNGEPLSVSGQLWFDRQWGRDVVNPHQSWDWFSLRLKGGAEVMLFVFRNVSSPVALGTFVPPSGDPVPLAGEDFVITPSASWTSPHTGITYPVAWHIDVPPALMSVDVGAVAADQEFNARSTTHNIYWEGLCRISGDVGGQSARGDAYVELANYP